MAILCYERYPSCLEWEPILCPELLGGNLAIHVPELEEVGMKETKCVSMNVDY